MTTNKKKRIGILTSGGDCAGLNAAIRAAVHRINTLGWECIGIRDSTEGLITRPMRTVNLTLKMVDGYMMRQGGTILGTSNKGTPYAQAGTNGHVHDFSEEIIESIRELGIDALIGIGGDGSFAILSKLAKQGGFNLVGIPKTIDNDVGLTDMSIGFTTAVEVAVEALDRLQPTAASHARVMVLEVMGRDAGHIGLTAGIAGGADVILIPEIPYDIEKVAQKIVDVRCQDRNFALVVVSEAVHGKDDQAIEIKYQNGQKRFGGIGHYLGEAIEKRTGHETRVTVLGHVQRGSQPYAQDRLIASAFGVHAVDLINEGKFGRMVAWSNRRVIDVPIDEAIAKYQGVDIDGPMVKTARALGICLGD